MCTAVYHKRCVHFTIISDLEAFNQILEANDVCNGLFGEPQFVLVAWYLTFLGDLESASITLHVKYMQGLEYL